MPDFEKTVKELEEIRGYFRAMAGIAQTNQGREGHLESARSIDDALALLKEQEPKPPAIKENAYGWKFSYCPSCSREFYIYRRPERVNETIFCDKCGQAVKWE